LGTEQSLVSTVILQLTQIGRREFHKSHAFDYRGDVPVCVGEDKSGEWLCSSNSTSVM